MEVGASELICGYERGRGRGEIEASNAKEFASYQCDAVKASAVEKSTGEGVFSVY